jgi:hypothetical protein
MDEQTRRNQQTERAKSRLLLWRLLSFGVSGLVALGVGWLIHDVILSTDAWEKLIPSLASVFEGTTTLSDFLETARDANILRPLDAAGWLLSILGGASAGLLALAIYVMIELYTRIANVDRVNLQISGHIGQIGAVLDNLESRHNVIQAGTEFGRVLALRDFTNRGLKEVDKWYAAKLSKDHCIVSTLVLERAEELLTSEQYMEFFVDLTLPANDYFRLVLARRPKHPQGLSAYGAISRKLGYRTAILSLSCWRDKMKPTLRNTLPNDVFEGVVQLVERNTELGVKAATLGDATPHTEEFWKHRLDPVLGPTLSDLEIQDIGKLAVQHEASRLAAATKLSDLRLANATYAGRIEKLEQDKREGESTIADFLTSDRSALGVIPEKSIEAYWRLLALLCEHYTMERFGSADLDGRFDVSIDQELCRRIQAVFATA